MSAFAVVLSVAKYLLFASIGGPQRPAAVVIPSACTCDSCHGAYRQQAKGDPTPAPSTIPESHRLTPSDIAAWAGPGGTFHANSPRVGKELEWFQVTGRVVTARIEADGNLHLQLADTASGGGTKVQVIVEVPPGRAWCAIRRQVFGWTTAHFPIRIITGATLELNQHSIVVLTGRAFYDAEHAVGADTRANRRVGAGGLRCTIWEIHPAMRLRIVQ